LYHFVPPQTRGAFVARRQINRGIAALLATTALVASPAVLLPGIALIAGLTAGSMPAFADGGADGSTRARGGVDSQTDPGGSGLNGERQILGSGGGGGGAGYVLGGSGGSILDPVTGVIVSPGGSGGRSPYTETLPDGTLQNHPGSPGQD
jgi:hypothetical protein